MITTTIGRLSGLAVGLGIGAAVAAAGTASADPAITSPPFDPANFATSFDGAALFREASTAATSGIGIGDIGAPVGAAGTASVDPAAVEMPPFDPNNFAVSIDGMTLFQEGTANATSGIGLGDIAIADGANAIAVAGAFPYPPLNALPFDFALAYGADARAAVPLGSFDSATVYGTNSLAGAVGFGSAADVIGTNAEARAGDPTGFFDCASIFNTGSAFDQAVAGGTTPSSFDIASVVGTDSTAFAGGTTDFSTPGSFDLAAAFGDMLHAVATGGNFLVDILP